MYYFFGGLHDAYIFVFEKIMMGLKSRNKTAWRYHLKKTPPKVMCRSKMVSWIQILQIIKIRQAFRRNSINDITINHISIYSAQERRDQRKHYERLINYVFYLLPRWRFLLDMGDLE